MERLLSWTFCYSIYDSICESNQSQPRNGSQKFLDHSKCNRQISPELTTFLNKCLINKAFNNSFVNLKNMEWMKYDLVLIKN